MQTLMDTTKTNGAKGLMANLLRLMTSWKAGRADRWDRVYLCSMAPMSAEFVRGREEAERHHPQW